MIKAWEIVIMDAKRYLKNITVNDCLWLQTE